MLPRQGLLRASQQSTSLTVGAQVAKLHAMLCKVFTYDMQEVNIKSRFSAV